MRFWSVHPSLLDTPRLNGVWREGLMGLRVLENWTHGTSGGYQHHPQLDRFKATGFPLESLSLYLHHIADEADKRNFNYNRSLIGYCRKTCELRLEYQYPLTVYLGQLKYEQALLQYKGVIVLNENLLEHPMFIATNDDRIADWERTKHHVLELMKGQRNENC